MDDNIATQQAELDTFLAIYGEDKLLRNLKKTPNITATVEIPCYFQEKQEIRIFTKKFIRTSLNDKLKLDFLFTELDLNYLPPLFLHLEFPLLYPSKVPPSFRLCCKWLNFTQLSKLCHKLDTIWCENNHNTILFDWFQFLSTELFQFLEIKFPYTLNLESPKHFHDHRAVQEAVCSSELLEFINEYNSHELSEDFRKQQQYCSICMESFPGDKCKQILPCQHSFCNVCLSKYLTTKILDSSIWELECAEGNCRTLLTNQIVLQSVTREIYERFDGLLLKKALEGMEDIVYCPLAKCGSPSELQTADKSMAICLVCRYCFCPKCRHVYHGISPCSINKFKEIVKEYKNANFVDKSILERKYGKGVLRQMIADVDDQLWFEKNTKKCPKCSVNIEKMFGCSKVHCSNCGTHFCWLCHQILPLSNPYIHYVEPSIGGDCVNKLFQGITVEEFEAWRFELD